VNFCHFVFKKNLGATWSRELVGKFSKNSPHFEEESYEIAQNFGRIGQISIFCLLKSPYLTNAF
jgi:hypothetical protein